MFYGITGPNTRWRTDGNLLAYITYIPCTDLYIWHPRLVPCLYWGVGYGRLLVVRAKHKTGFGRSPAVKNSRKALSGGKGDWYGSCIWNREFGWTSWQGMSHNQSHRRILVVSCKPPPHTIPILVGWDRDWDAWRCTICWLAVSFQAKTSDGAVFRHQRSCSFTTSVQQGTRPSTSFEETVNHWRNVTCVWPRVWFGQHLHHQTSSILLTQWSQSDHEP